MAHALHTCLIAVSLGRAQAFLRASSPTVTTTLLRFVGCTSDSHELMDFLPAKTSNFVS
jgi:hypothetical protein